MIESGLPEGNAIAMNRLEQLRSWASSVLDVEHASMVPASEDASFRRYFRFRRHGGGSVIAMDAPPPHEDCSVFVRVAEVLSSAGVNVPKVMAHDFERGFLLLSDFGVSTYLADLDDRNADARYRPALSALVRLQCASRPGVFPEYDEALLRRDVDLFPEWYVTRHLGASLDAAQTSVLNAVVARLLANNLAQPRVYVHRDYHSRNLMVTEPMPGVLDFQDAVYGPITYDLVSLLKDAYVRWPEERVIDWAICYWQEARRARLPVPTDFADFYRDFEWMGVQRHLKVVGIFARLWHRDGKERYLADIPLVLDYLLRAARRYGELAPLARLIDQLQGRSAQVAHTF
jgi:aminoglycoside/choline kinase family phosphotransferase